MAPCFSLAWLIFSCLVIASCKSPLLFWLQTFLSPCSFSCCGGHSCMASPLGVHIFIFHSLNPSASRLASNVFLRASSVPACGYPKFILLVGLLASSFSSAQTSERTLICGLVSLSRRWPCLVNAQQTLPPSRLLWVFGFEVRG
ncbi:hypothetical protein BKA81DRAFT_203339 [Phyllosticta paracitricarpa]